MRVNRNSTLSIPTPTFVAGGEKLRVVSDALRRKSTADEVHRLLEAPEVRG